jgi:sugar (pentulose or hexulose) kinase
MNSVPVILIFDIGKTNKKTLLFDEQYQLVFEQEIQFQEILDEQGDPCEDVIALTNWVKESIQILKSDARFVIKAIHYSTYGASFVYLNENGEVIAPLYNYLKPYKESTRALFEKKYGSIKNICLETASPDLGNLNSGLQIFRLKVEQPDLFSKIKWALHLPQYIHCLLTGSLAADITSIGCHTFLWDFTKQQYHNWVIQEGIDKLFPTIKQNVGLHDSSAALIPYFSAFESPFILLSTGTWCISMNPFNHTPLTAQELQEDALCYLSYQGKPVKAARLFAGKFHEIEVKKLHDLGLSKSDFEKAYAILMEKIVRDQVYSTNLILKGTSVKRIFVDGGFSKNEHYMNGLAKAYPEIEVYAATIAQASAIGAALSIHEKWNSQPKPNSLLAIKYYSSKQE